MPLGVIIIKWDNKLGGVVESRYLRRGWIPPSLPTTLLSMHFPNMKIDQSALDFVTTKIGNVRVLSYFIGTKAKRSVAVVLEETEDPNLFKDKIIKFSEKISGEFESSNSKIAKYYGEVFEK